MTTLHRSLLVVATALAAPVAGAPQEGVLDATVPAARARVEWDARAVEHLCNRAAFGARPAEIRRWQKSGQDALVKHLLAEPEDGESYFVERLNFDAESMRGMDRDAQRRARAVIRNDNRRQGQAYLNWWIERMLDGDDPLRDRMTLFWHGFFTSAATKVRLSYPMIRQNQLLREHALGNYGTLLAKMLEDPAMLIYLDNITNRRDHPNENLARELMELFSLGEGNYSERDVKEVARALTGYGIDRDRVFRYDPRSHDHGKKTVLGAEGRHDAQDVVEILLEQPACARWVAGSILEYLEGTPPDEARLAAYAAFLREKDYEISPFLDRLFRDPAFYRDEIVGAKVSSPIEYLVGSTHRLGLQVHPMFVHAGATMLGQQLFEPPNVKGWEGGAAWITTATFMNRGNLIGMLLGVVEVDDLAEDPVAALGDPDSELVAEVDVEGAQEDAGDVVEDAATVMTDDARMAGGDVMMAGDDTMMSDEPSAEVAREAARRNEAMRRIFKVMQTSGYRPRIHLTARLARRDAKTDRAIVDDLCDELLAIDAPLETRRMLTAFLREERGILGIEAGGLLEHGEEAEALLRRLAHLILSLPEAHLG